MKDLESLLAKADTSGGAQACWPWQGYTRPGPYNYGVARVHGVNGGLPMTASRAALILSSGKDEPSLGALHTCDSPSCVNPAHLYWGDQSRNNLDAIERGRKRRPPGSRSRRNPWFATEYEEYLSANEAQD